MEPHAHRPVIAMQRTLNCLNGHASHTAAEQVLAVHDAQGTHCGTAQHPRANHRSSSRDILNLL